uniref:Uncharacterized protein n=1 Tax=viral metagenome TaxID=1070528 RepID=A0A6C0J8H2_9ZZZZ
MTQKQDNFKQFLLQAQEKFITELMLSRDDTDNVITNLQHVKNWPGHILKLDDILYEDDIIVNDGTKEYKFSKLKFLENKYFARSLIYNYKQKLGSVYVKIIKTRYDTWLIKFSKLLVRTY